MNFRRSTLAFLIGGLLAVTPIAAGAPAHAAGGVPGARQIIVRVDPAVTTIESINAAVGTSTSATSTGIAATYLLTLPAGADRDAVAAAVGALPGVRWAIANKLVNPPEVDHANIYAWNIYAWTLGDPLPAASQYAPAAINLTQAQQLSTGAGIVVAVLDTGVQLDPVAHVALASSLVQGVDLVDGDTVPAETRNGMDDDGDTLIDEGVGHGTHVAGIVHQVAPQAKIMPVRILDDDGTGTMWNAAEGMFWAAQHGAKVINMSLGTHGSATVLREAVTTVFAQGVLVVAAAGNDGENRKMFPAAAPEAVAVGAVGRGDVVSPFTNFGSWIDVVAPGEAIHSTYAFPANSFAFNSGTSMASPWVAGEAALVLARAPGLSPADVTAAITSGAKLVDAINPAYVGKLGAGRIDLLSSLHLV